MKFGKQLGNVLENTISLFSLKGIDLGLTIFLIPYLILKVGIDNYGHYVFVMSIVYFLLNILNYGFNLTAVRDLAKNKKNALKVNDIFNEVITVKLYLFIVIYSVFLVLIIFLPTTYELRSIYLVGSFLLISDLFSVRWLFLGVEKMKYITLINLSGGIIYVFLVINFINVEADFEKIPLCEAVGTGMVSIISFVWVVRKRKIRIRLISIDKVLIYLKTYFSSFISLLLPSTYGVISIFLAGFFCLPAQLSVFQMGLKFTSAFSTINSVLTNVFYPLINKKNELMAISRLVLIGLGGFLSLIMYFSSDFIIAFWLKKNSLTAVEELISVVKILSVTPLLMGVISSYGVNGLLAYFKDGILGKIVFISTLFMIVSSIWLIPIYGIYGGAISFILGRTIYGILASYMFYRIRKNVEI
ncbi:oligosaccharide flippase family protein [Flavicella sediminum]|uniref:oligosaccharide flippase family protein n=1 Tax=Flavicella sediminum TaxID=2585141 RepID=UPI00111EC147|nr:oligosaccharide flippase family protein [Flavicella sediminum]